MNAPLMKAQQIQTSLAICREMTGPRADEFDAAIGPAALEQIESTHRTAWVPLELDFAVCHALEKVLGEGANVERSRRAVRQSMSSSMLKPIVDGALRLFGLSPSKVLRVSVTGWKSIYRDVGAPRFEHAGPTAARIVFDDLPHEVLASRMYLHAIGGGLSAIFDLCDVEGEVQLHVDDVQRQAELRFSWS